jgi:predicted phage terminase large subunit-like protein
VNGTHDASDDRSLLLTKKRIIAARKARDKLIGFTKLTFPHQEDPDNPDRSSYEDVEFHRMIAEICEDIEARKRLRILLSIPPQHGKSQIISRRAPAWCLGRSPYQKFIVGTYANDFAEDIGEEVRAVMMSPVWQQVFPKVQLRKGSKAKNHLVVEQGGSINFVGRGGQLNGRPGDVLFIDDIFSGDAEARSRAVRNAAWLWLTRTVFFRMHKLSAIVIVMTRWSDDDPIARLTDKKNPYYREEAAKQWTVINIPAIIDDEGLAKALGKQKGDLLWPERFSREQFDAERLIDPIGFSALRMGRPQPPEGTFFKKEDFSFYDSVDEIPKNLRNYGSCDLAVSETDLADRSCVGNWGLDEEDGLWLLPELYWERKLADHSVDMIVDFGVRYSWWDLYAENVVIDKAVGAFLRKAMEERGAGFNIEQFPTAGDKGARCLSFRGRMKQGKVKFPRFAHWWPKAEEEMLDFTGSGDDKHDDFVDMCGLMGQGIMKVLRASRPAETNVVPIKSGTFGWLKQEDNKRKAALTLIASRGGM